MSAPGDEFQQIIVPPRDGKREMLGLLGAIAAICLLVALRLLLLPDNSSFPFKQPYHRLDNTLSPQERLLYQTLLAAKGEIIYWWQKNATWPNVELLAQEGVPPFAADLLPPLLEGYTWTTHDRGPWVDYLGHAQSGTTAGPSVLLRIIDLHADFHPHPHPGKDYDPKEKTAVQIWMHPLNQQAYAGMQLYERGWFWIVSPGDPALGSAPARLKEKG
jgi:hypothetical protein